MKLLFTFVGMLAISLSAHASDFALKVMPESPVVMSSDYSDGQKQLEGPWFGAVYRIENTSANAITLENLEVGVDIGGGLTQYFEFPMKNVEIAAGQGFETEMTFVDGIMSDDTFAMKAHAEVHGWIGTAKNPSGRISIPVDFVTQ